VWPDEEERDEHWDVGGGFGLKAREDKGKGEGGKVDVGCPWPVGRILSQEEVIHPLPKKVCQDLG
jgi:hypothetical protein